LSHKVSRLRGTEVKKIMYCSLQGGGAQSFTSMMTVPLEAMGPAAATTAGAAAAAAAAAFVLDGAAAAFFFTMVLATAGAALVVFAAALGAWRLGFRVSGFRVRVE